MSTRLIAGTIMSAVLLVVTLLALRGCESSPEPPVDTMQYPNEETTEASGGRTTSNYEKTPSYYEVQYPSELPGTGGVRLW